MKYLLSEDEIRALGPVSETEKYKSAAMELSKMLARLDKGCILDPQPTIFPIFYCSDCMAETLCPYEHKEYGK